MSIQSTLGKGRVPVKIRARDLAEVAYTLKQLAGVKGRGLR